MEKLSDGGISVRQALISLISTLDAKTLPALLSHIEDMVAETGSEKELLIVRNEISKQILEKVGDTEKEIAMEWWFRMRETIDIQLEEQQDGLSLSR